MNAPKLVPRLLLGEQGWGLTRAILLLVEDALRVVSLIPEVLLHRSFGCRYLTVEIATVIGLFMFLQVMFVPSVGCKLVGVLFLVLVIWHLVAIWRRQRQGIHVHTRYTGEPYSFWWHLGRWVPIDEIAVKRWLEPGAILLFALVMQYVDVVFACFLVICGMALAMRVALEYRRWRERVLDLLDAQLEGEMLNEATKGVHDARELQGCPTVGAFAGNGEAREALANAIKNAALETDSEPSADAESSAAETKLDAPTPTALPGFDGLDPALQQFILGGERKAAALEAAGQRHDTMPAPGASGIEEVPARNAIQAAPNGNGKMRQERICRCPWCRKSIRIAGGRTGQEVMCPNPICGHQFTLPPAGDAMQE